MILGIGEEGNTIQLACTFTDKDGEPINLTGHTVRLVAYKFKGREEFLDVAITSFTGTDSNVATFLWQDEETDLWSPVEYRWYIQLELSTGEIYSSKKGFLKVSRDRATDADYRLVFGGDNIICTIEDDVTIDEGEEPVVGVFDITFDETFA